MQNRNSDLLKRLLKKYDVELAIEARRILLFELHSEEECQRLIWQPTKKLLQELTEQNPAKLICLHGSPCTYNKPSHPSNQGGKSCNIDLVGPKNKLIYLGMVLDLKEAEDLWKWYLARYPESSLTGKMLRQKGPMAIMREERCLHCNIPVESDRLDQPALKKGVYKCMQLFAPALANLPVQWLSKNQRNTIENFLWQEAKHRSRPQTKEERLRIIREDFEKNSTG